MTKQDIKLIQDLNIAAKKIMGLSGMTFDARLLDLAAIRIEELSDDADSWQREARGYVLR